MKYNWSIIGHKNQLLRIENDIRSGNLSHAYLLAGPNSVGKHTVSKKMAGILQCENDFCHKCKTCIQLQNNSHIDTIVMRGRDSSIKIEDVRKLIERINMTKQSPYKLFLIQSIERMTKEAANSFLKVLEEPPSGTVFILTTNNIRAVLPTIVSRVRTIKFGVVSASYLESKLKELYPDHEEETIKTAALFSLGKTGKALHLMENPDSLSSYYAVYRKIQNFLTSNNIVDRFSYTEDLLEDSKNLDVFFSMLTNVLRSKILEGDKETFRHINTLSKLQEAGILLKQNVNSRLVLENLMLQI